MTLLLQVIKGLYIIYMFNYFKTSCSIHHPWEKIVTGDISNWFEHPINTGKYQNKICTLGNVVGFLLAIWFITYYYLQHDLHKFHKTLMVLILIICLIMNLNAFVYFLPLFIFDFCTLHVN